MRLPFTSSLAFLVLGFAASARAQDEDAGRPQRVGVVRLEFAGGVPEAGRELFAQRLVEGLAAARFEVLAGAALERKLREAGASPCQDVSCYPDVARTLGAGYLVTGKVVEQSKTYVITLEVINGRTGAVLASNRERCETCGIEEAGEKMNLAASALRARLEAVARMPSRFVIRSRPSGARARIDGKSVGETPLNVELAGGSHRLTLDLGGYEDLQRTFVAVSGVDETLDLDLVHQPSTFPYRAVGWTGIAVGAALIGAGVVALAMDGSEVACTAAERDERGNCPRVHDTDILGALLIGAGAVAGSIGGVSLFLATRGVGSLEPSASGDTRVGLVFRGRF